MKRARKRTRRFVSGTCHLVNNATCIAAETGSGSFRRSEPGAGRDSTTRPVFRSKTWANPSCLDPTDWGRRRRRWLGGRCFRGGSLLLLLLLDAQRPFSTMGQSLRGFDHATRRDTTQFVITKRGPNEPIHSHWEKCIYNKSIRRDYVRRRHGRDSTTKKITRANKDKASVPPPTYDRDELTRCGFVDSGLAYR